MSILSFPNTRNLLNNKKKKKVAHQITSAHRRGREILTNANKADPNLYRKKKGVARSRQ